MNPVSKALCFLLLMLPAGFSFSHADWIEDGVPMTGPLLADVSASAVVSDGISGAILAFTACRGEVPTLIAQRVDATGVALWGDDGVTLCTAGNQDYPQIMSDGAGGAIVTWMDYRSGNWDIYAQRVDGSGVVQWIVDGVALSTVAGDQEGPQIMSDGAGGAIVTWEDDRNGTYDIYAQRVDGSGAVQWTVDGVPLSTAAGDQKYPQITPDGVGGAIVTWHDNRSGNWIIYAQRVDGSGAVQWIVNGVPLSTAAGDQRYPQIIPHGAGGAIVTWQDFRSGYSDIYAQRVDGSGTVQWTVNGIALSTAAVHQYYPQITPDGAGGAIVTWEDYRSGNADIYAQRVSGSGVVQWTVNGVPLYTAAGHQYSPQITSDGAGGAIVTWMDYRSGNWDIYAQRVDGFGVVQWMVDGVSLSTVAEDQWYPQIISDGAGGAIVAWPDKRSGNWDIYAQRVDGSGAVQWTADGIPFCTTKMGDQVLPQITSDGAGGAIVTWEDYRSGTWDIYAQHVDGSGAVQWTVDGVALSTAAGDQYFPQITSDGAGGAIVAWYDRRNGTWDIYAQRVDGSGAVQWTVDGVPLSTAAGNQYSPQITSDGAGGAIVTWHDYRSLNADIYAQRVDGSGAVQWTVDGIPLSTAAGDQYYPQITSYGASGAIVTWEDGRNGINDIYAQRMDGSGAVQWTVDGIPLCMAAGYQGSPQITDDGAGGAIVAWVDYRCGTLIYAQRLSRGGVITSTTLHQYSAVLEGNGVHICWTLAEIDDNASFSVFRASAPAWDYIELNDARIQRDGLSFTFNDSDCDPGSMYRYMVRCEVEGQPTRVLFETETITIPAPPMTLYPSYPNPFNPQTVIQFYLPAAQEISLDIYNVAGQWVARLAEGEKMGGYHEVRWDGRNSAGVAVASGVYLARLRAGKRTKVTKLVLMK